MELVVVECPRVRDVHHGGALRYELAEGLLHILVGSADPAGADMVELRGPELRVDDLLRRSVEAGLERCAAVGDGEAAVS